MWLVVDFRDGMLDGWYASQDMALDAAEYWREKLGHKFVVVVKREDPVNTKHWLIGPCFAADRSRCTSFALMMEQPDEPIEECTGPLCITADTRTRLHRFLDS